MHRTGRFPRSFFGGRGKRRERSAIAVMDARIDTIMHYVVHSINRIAKSLARRFARLFEAFGVLEARPAECRLPLAVIHASRIDSRFDLTLALAVECPERCEVVRSRRSIRVEPRSSARSRRMAEA